MHPKIRELNQELKAPYLKITPADGKEFSQEEMDRIKAEKDKLDKKMAEFNFKSGDTLRVHVAIREGEKERIQVFEGIVIRIKGTPDMRGSFTVRKMSNGVSVVRTFPYFSPFVVKVEKTRIGEVRRAKLYYLEALTGKAARIKDRFVGGKQETPETPKSE